MLHMMCEKYGNDPKCKMKVRGKCSNLVHKPPTLYVQEESRETIGMMQFP